MVALISKTKSFGKTNENLKTKTNEKLNQKELTQSLWLTYTILKCLKAAGFTKKQGNWLPHERAFGLPFNIPILSIRLLLLPKVLIDKKSPWSSR